MQVEPPAKVKKLKGKNNEIFALKDALHCSEDSSGSDPQPQEKAHSYEVILEPSSYSEEKFALYQKYQSDIHHDLERQPTGFKRFLCASPLKPEPIPYPTPPPPNLPTNYGSYHQLHKVDGKLMAMSVIDILPNCVSSVYFMYDKAFEKFSLGKLSALREIALAQEISDGGAPDVKFLYLGFYIHSCQKMRYKGDYSPSFLADPETYEWFPIDQCKRALDTHRYASFSHPEHSIEGEADFDMVEEALEHEPSEPDDGLFSQIKVLEDMDPGGQVTVKPALLSSAWTDAQSRRGLLCCVEGLGRDVSRDIIFVL